MPIPIVALGVAKATGGWLLGNWRWAVPAAAFLALGAYAVDRTVRVSNLRAEIAGTKAAMAKAVSDQKEKDRLLAISISAELAEQNARAGAVVTTRTEIIYREKPVLPHVDTPAVRESTAGLRELGFRGAARPGAGDPGDGAAAP